jgi:hypothetical protein
LEALPILTKATLMERFDELVTDRDVRLGDVEAHLASGGPTTNLFRGRYRVAATGGPTGASRDRPRGGVDTAFHATLTPDGYRYAVPEAWYRDWASGASGSTACR